MYDFIVKKKKGINSCPTKERKRKWILCDIGMMWITFCAAFSILQWVPIISLIFEVGKHDIPEPFRHIAYRIIYLFSPVDLVSYIFEHIIDPNSAFVLTTTIQAAFELATAALCIAFWWFVYNKLQAARSNAEEWGTPPSTQTQANQQDGNE